MTTRGNAGRRRVELFAILLGLWLLLSGHVDPLHLGFGVVCAALVAAVSSDLVLPAAAPLTFGAAARLAGYFPWLLWQMVLANLHVIFLILRPAAMRPQVVRFRTPLTSDLAKVVLGNSITLTPGTVTLEIEGDAFTVHALSDRTADDLRSGAMERRVARLFGEAERGAAGRGTPSPSGGPEGDGPPDGDGAPRHSGREGGLDGDGAGESGALRPAGRDGMPGGDEPAGRKG